MPVSRDACWAAIKVVWGRAGHARTWDPLMTAMSLLLAAPVDDVGSVELPRVTHADALALRALMRFDRSVPRAIEIMQAWAQAACDL